MENKSERQVINCGLVLEGGGMRGSFTMGVLDFLDEQKLLFSFVVGVSAGASNACSYVSGQHGRNIDIATTFIKDHRYLSWRNFLRRGSVFGMDFGFKTIPAELNPFEFKKFQDSPAKLHIGVTDCLSGESHFFDSSTMSQQQLTDTLIASCSLPIMGTIKQLESGPCLDGGITASIPIDYALQQGSRKNLVILTREQGYRKKRPPKSSHWLVKAYFKKYPKLAAALLKRADNYNQSLTKVYGSAQKGEIFLIQPPTKLPGGRTEKDPAVLKQMYNIGYQQAKKLLPELKSWLQI